MPSTTIRFYFDYISPNAYLAWTQLPTLTKRYSATIDPGPVLFAGFLGTHGQLGPAEIPAKILWMSKNNLREAALLRVALNPPAFHPFNPLLALRVSSLPLKASERHAVIDALFQGSWMWGLHVAEPAMVEQVPNAIGLPEAMLVAEAQHPECKARLRQQTDDAMTCGVFGVPTMEVSDKLFWGYDDFPYLELFLEGKDPLDPTEWQRWLIPSQPSAIHRRVHPKNAGT